jgi:hypothetical protein
VKNTVLRSSGRLSLHSAKVAVARARNEFCNDSIPQGLMAKDSLRAAFDLGQSWHGQVEFRPFRAKSLGAWQRCRPELYQ